MKFKLVQDNKSKYYGVTDFDKHLIKVNRKMAKSKGSKGELLDSIEHEFNHVRHPKMSEKKIQKLTLKTTAHMSKKSKQKVYKALPKVTVRGASSLISKKNSKKKVGMYGLI